MSDGLNVKAFSGLTESEAARRFKLEGANELPSSKQRSVFRIAFSVASEPMFLLLIAGGMIYLALGDPQEAVLLLGFVLVIIGITFYQERKTERALEALRDLTSPRALVIRDEKATRIAGREVVRDDILLLGEGDRVPADAVVLEQINLSLDESLLTGESLAVRKKAGTRNLELQRPGGEDLPFVYAGTLVVQGRALALVKAIGTQSEIGKIGKAIGNLESERTLLQREVGSLVRIMASAGLAFCAVVVLIYGLVRHDWLGGLLAGIAMAMALLPEEFPVVLTVFMALGAWRIAQKRVLARRSQVIETLGAATVLCVDKTGTLTHNKMSVARLQTGNASLNILDSSNTLPEEFHELLEFSMLSSHRDPFDPMEQAISQLGSRTLTKIEQHRDWDLVREYPLSVKLLALSLVWSSKNRQNYTIAAKGAPEAIFDLCHLSQSQTRELQDMVGAMADDAFRVLGVARAYFKPVSLELQALPSAQHDFDFEFLGLLGFADPIREAVPQAIHDAYSAGIRVVMITGDYAGTARNVARQIGLTDLEQVITGLELDAMSDQDLAVRARSTNIFARVVPEQKLRLVNAFKADGEIVAMTGDGVNDAPALKAAHIGIAMGGRGTDVAREASALVVLDDDFSSIVHAVRMGRRIYDNLKKALAYTIAVHVPIAGLSLLPVLFGWPLILMPVHIVFLELIIDPACSIVFEAEPEEADVMSRPPRAANRPLFDAQMLGLSVVQGLSVLVFVLVVFGISMARGQNAAEARALTFTSLIVANLGLILTNLSWSRSVFATLREPNAALWWVLSGAVGFLGLVLYLPGLRHLFSFTFLHLDDLLICLGVGITSVVWFEVFKLLTRRTPGSKHPTQLKRNAKSTAKL
jgi:P-type Ca2+ transporter type 2C